MGTQRRSRSTRTTEGKKKHNRERLQKRRVWKAATERGLPRLADLAAIAPLMAGSETP